MAKISKKRVASFLAAGANAATTTEQGRAYEDLVAYLFESVPGIAETFRNQVNVLHSEEVDVVFWNDRAPDGFWFLQELILVECKDWSAPVGSQHVSWFLNKLRTKALLAGVLVAANGITGSAQDRTAAYTIIAQALLEGRRIIVLTTEDLLAINSPAALVALVKKKLCQVTLLGSF
jgi:hypothetical protein